MKNLLASRRVFFLFFILIIGLASFLRLYKLASLPPSLYWDELSLGYDAYSILQTGKDHHGNPWPLISFTSYGDYKPSGYFYAIVPFMAVFGLNEWSVRLPSAVAGIFIVLGMGVFTRIIAHKIWQGLSINDLRLAQLIGMAVASISPWLLQFSRAGWEVNVATALLFWAVLLGIQTHHKQRYLLLFFSATFAALSMYTYHATRLVAPLVLLAVFLLQLLESDENGKWRLKYLQKSLVPLLLPGLFFILLVSPLLFSVSDPTTQQRFAETSLLSDGEYVRQSNAQRELAPDNFISRLFTHRYLFAGQQLVGSFLSHFSADFLFISGDQNLRHSTGYTGVLMITDSIWLFLGIGAVSLASLKQPRSRKVILLLLFWLCVGVVPAALTKATPHALRILPTAPIFLLLISLGFLQLYLWLKKHSSNTVLTAVLVLAVIGTIGYWFSYWRYYTKVYPSLTANQWQYGYKEMVTKVEALRQQEKATPFFITREQGRPAMNYWFYTQTPPAVVQSVAANTAKDQGEFLAFENIEFINTVSEAKPGIVVSSVDGFEQLSDRFSSVEKLDEVKDLRGQPVWVLSRVTFDPQPNQ